MNYECTAPTDLFPHEGLTLDRVISASVPNALKQWRMDQLSLCVKTHLHHGDNLSVWTAFLANHLAQYRQTKHTTIKINTAKCDCCTTSKMKGRWRSIFHCCTLCMTLADSWIKAVHLITSFNTSESYSTFLSLGVLNHCIMWPHS